MDDRGNWVRAVDNFIAQNEQDLEFSEGNIIKLLCFADENWGVGCFNGKKGIFPICFTEPCQVPPANVKNGIGHFRISSAPVDIPNRTTSLPPETDSGDEVQLINAIYELRDTELSFHNDIKFILTDVKPTVPKQYQELLFSGLDELGHFSARLHENLQVIANKKNRYEQCILLYKVFLRELVNLRDVYAPYCARQSKVATTTSGLSEELEVVEEKISSARREGKTQAFNLNSLLIKPVQRVTKYPLLLEQIMKAAPQDCRLQMSDVVKEVKGTLLEINNQKRHFETVNRFINAKPDRNSNVGLENDENPMKKIKKKLDRIMNPILRDENEVFPRPKSKKSMLNRTTQSSKERSYVLETYQSNLFIVKKRWTNSDDVADCWVTPGDIVARIESAPLSVDKTKIMVDSGRKKGLVPLRILSEFPPVPKISIKKSLVQNDSSESDFASDPEILETGPAGVKSQTENNLIKFDDSAIAQYDFRGRSDGELTIAENEVLTILARQDMDGNSEWFKVQNNFGKSGYVPSSYLSTAST